MDTLKAIFKEILRNSSSLVEQGKRSTRGTRALAWVRLNDIFTEEFRTLVEQQSNLSPFCPGSVPDIIHENLEKRTIETRPQNQSQSGFAKCA